MRPAKRSHSPISFLDLLLELLAVVALGAIARLGRALVAVDNAVLFENLRDRLVRQIHRLEAQQVIAHRRRRPSRAFPS